MAVPMVAAADVLARYSEQAPVTAWPERLLLTVVVAGTIALSVWAMVRNWRKRIARQDWVQLPAGPPPDFAPTATYRARYVASVSTEDWLDRIAAQGLGMPGNAEVALGRTGVLIRREAEQDLFLPLAAIEEIATARGIAQEVYERDGLVAITWRSGERRVTTGLRMSRAQDHVALVDAVNGMIGKAEV